MISARNTPPTSTLVLRLKATPGISTRTPSDQQIISVHKTSSTLRCSRHAIVGDGCLSSKRLDPQPEIGALLPRWTQEEPSLNCGSPMKTVLASCLSAYPPEIGRA